MELVRLAVPAGPVATEVAEPLRPRVLQGRPRAWAAVEERGRLVGLLFAEEVSGIPPGTEVRFHAPGLPEEGLRGRRTQEAPRPMPGDPSTVAVELESAPGSRTPPLGTVGWIDLPARAFPALVVPSGAILPSPEGPVVLVREPADGHLVRRPVTPGRSSFGTTVLFSGVVAGDRVVLRDAFFLEAEESLAPSGRR
jgi:hypothetical protein